MQNERLGHGDGVESRPGQAPVRVEPFDPPVVGHPEWVVLFTAADVLRAAEWNQNVYARTK
jgi:hypothetical protein